MEASSKARNNALGQEEALPPLPDGQIPCLHWLRQEFTLKHLGFSHCDPSLFLRSEWPRVTATSFAVYRGVVGLGLLGWILIDLSFEFRGIPQELNHVRLWLTYATNWALLLLAVALLSLVVVTVFYNITQKGETPEKLHSVTFLWFFYTSATTSVFTTDLIFWIFLSHSHFVAFSSNMAKVKHGITWILVLVDLFMSRIPIRLLHFVYAGMWGLVYTCFTMLIWRWNVVGPDGVGAIYPSINWSDPKTTLAACALAFLTMILVHMLLFGLYVLRSGLGCVMRGRRFKDFFLEGIEDPAEQLLLLADSSQGGLAHVHVSSVGITTVVRSNNPHGRTHYDQLE